MSSYECLKPLSIFTMNVGKSNRLSEGFYKGTRREMIAVTLLHTVNGDCSRLAYQLIIRKTAAAVQRLFLR
jgi:hypothetical protein